MLDSNMYIDKYFDFVDYKGFGDVSVGKMKLQKGTPVLAFQNLDYQYADGTNKVLENVNFKIDAGDKVAFIGGDGSGKSTLVKMLCGLYEVTAGDYVVGKYSVRELERGDLKDRISLVTQDFNKYSLSIKENITIGEKDEIKHTLYEKVKRVCGIDEFIEHEGITEDQRLGKAFDKGREISPGYWQRIAIARALYRNKQIFILDEPFTYVDQEARRKMLKSIVSFVGPDRTLICIFQGTENIDLFDRVYTLKHGKVQQIISSKAAK
jgi:ABC-type multidrug transport system fused ATPase/permease subunit